MGNCQYPAPLIIKPVTSTYRTRYYYFSTLTTNSRKLLRVQPLFKSSFLRGSRKSEEFWVLVLILYNGFKLYLQIWSINSRIIGILLLFLVKTQRRARLCFDLICSTLHLPNFAVNPSPQSKAWWNISFTESINSDDFGRKCEAKCWLEYLRPNSFFVTPKHFSLKWKSCLIVVFVFFRGKYFWDSS